MRVIRRTWLGLLLLALCGAALLTLSCESRQRVAGTYRAEDATAAKPVQVNLQLKENGEGSWSRGSEEVPFSWYLEAGDVRMNTKGGGVLVGRVEGEAIHVALPGGKVLVFRREK